MATVGRLNGGVATRAPERATKIVATLGPATSDAATIAALIAAGVNVFRLNFSHGTHADHAANVRRVRAAAQAAGVPIAIMQDLQGPKIRTGPLAGGVPVTLKEGAAFRITSDPVIGTAARVSTTYDNLPQDVRPGDQLLLDDGTMTLRVVAVEGHDVVTEVVYGGLLRAHKGINLPGVRVSTPALTAKDTEDLAFGFEIGVDLVAISFIRTAADVRHARSALRKLSAKTPLIAKIEKPEALDDLPGILDAADGVMVARGDLGVELSPERVPSAQKRIIRMANDRCKVVITATQMLESMTERPQPTRAEAADVFNAILDGTDAVMLSGETAIGHYPVETVRMMRRIADQAERALPDRLPRRRVAREPPQAALADAAVRLAEETDAKALVVFTQSGFTAHLISSRRPRLPIIALTVEPSVHRRLALWWGLTPVCTRFGATMEATLPLFEEALCAQGLVCENDLVVIVGSSMKMRGTRSNMIKLHVVGRE